MTDAGVLVGTVRRFGPYGPIYEVVADAASGADGKPLVFVRVIESGEELDYPAEEAIADPIEADAPEPRGERATPASHRATCACGQLSANCEGEPVRVSVCHCLDCQRRSGSAFSAQARFPDAAVTIAGASKTWRRVGDSGSVAEFSFCPECGATVFYRIDAMQGLVAIPLGTFAKPGFPAPRFSVYENRKHAWVEITGEGVEHD